MEDRKMKIVILQRWLAVLLLTPLACSPTASLVHADDPPPWGQLDPFQRTMSREEFQSRLDRVFSPGGAFQRFVVRNSIGPRRDR